MGYPLAALDQTRTFVDLLRAGSLPAATLAAPEKADGPAALRWEVEQASADAGRVVSRLTRLMFEVMSSSAAGEGGGGLHPGE
jgi:hypothetical protein